MPYRRKRPRRTYALARPRRRISRPRWFRRGRKSKKIPMLPLAGLGAMVATPGFRGVSIVDDVMKGDFNGAMYDARERFLCVDNTGKFQVGWVLPNYAPLIFGVIGHMVAQKVGINKYFDRIPVVGKYLSL
jgi:hypothetical protein